MLSDEVLVCPSFLAGTPGTVPFSVSLNGVDFIADATAQMQYKFYEQPDYHIGLDPTGGPRQVRVRVRVRAWVRGKIRVRVRVLVRPNLTLTLTLTLALTRGRAARR